MEYLKKIEQPCRTLFLPTLPPQPSVAASNTTIAANAASTNVDVAANAVTTTSTCTTNTAVISAIVANTVAGDAVAANVIAANAVAINVVAIDVFTTNTVTFTAVAINVAVTNTARVQRHVVTVGDCIKLADKHRSEDGVAFPTQLNTDRTFDVCWVLANLGKTRARP